MSTREVVRSLELGRLVKGALIFREEERDGYSFRGFSGCCELTEDMVSDVEEVSLRCFGEGVEDRRYWGRKLG